MKRCLNHYTMFMVIFIAGLSILSLSFTRCFSKKKIRLWKEATFTVRVIVNLVQQVDLLI